MEGERDVREVVLAGDPVGRQDRLGVAVHRPLAVDPVVLVGRLATDHRLLEAGLGRLLGRLLADERAVLEHVDPVADLEDLVEFVGDEDERRLVS